MIESIKRSGLLHGWLIGAILFAGIWVLCPNAFAQSSTLNRPDVGNVSPGRVNNNSGNASGSRKMKKSQRQRTQGRVVNTVVKNSTPVRVHQKSMEEAYREGKAYFDRGEYHNAYAPLESAASREHDEAQLLLGFLHRTGEGCEKSDVKAYNWFRLSAFNGNPYAQFFYGECLIYGEGCDADPTEAATWIRKAAEDEIGDAQLLLAVMFEKGVGVSPSMEEAFRWYKAAARLDIYEACYRLADCYENGIGTRQNLTQAAKWRARGEELEDLVD